MILSIPLYCEISSSPPQRLSYAFYYEQFLHFHWNRGKNTRTKWTVSWAERQFMILFAHCCCYPVHKYRNFKWKYFFFVVRPIADVCPTLAVSIFLCDRHHRSNLNYENERFCSYLLAFSPNRPEHLPNATEKRKNKKDEMSVTENAPQMFLSISEAKTAATKKTKHSKAICIRWKNESIWMASLSGKYRWKWFPSKKTIIVLRDSIWPRRISLTRSNTHTHPAVSICVNGSEHLNRAFKFISLSWVNTNDLN